MSSPDPSEIVAGLERICGPDGAIPGDGPRARPLLHDTTEDEGIAGHADAVAFPSTAPQVAEVLAFCYENDLPLTPRGGGTGLAAGSVPGGGVLLDLGRLDRVRAFDGPQWRMEAEAGVSTADVQRLAREGGLLFAPDPGAREQSTIGGNIATNAGGPHAFKYGVTSRWVTGLEVAVAPGELMTVGGPLSKDVAGYDLVGLLCGSEGTLGIVTCAWLRLIPAPEEQVTVAAFYPGPDEGCAAIATVMEAGARPATLEYLDAGAVAAAGGSFPGGAPQGAGFMVLSEADGSAAEAQATAAALEEILGAGAISVHRFGGRGEEAELARWRDGVAIAVSAQQGGKVSDDIAVPVERLAEAIGETLAIGERHGLEACSWGHAGDGNLHSTFMLDRADADAVARAREAAEELCEMADRLGGTISGEHGIGTAKAAHLGAGWDPARVRLHRQLKEAFDPKGLLNPGKKVTGGAP
ncbi:MAG: FAD-binding protein [Solirubrobacteraceae bacterium]|nr:FAD-binding protein [Solirubrobacteraceae bacterium]